MHPSAPIQAAPSGFVVGSCPQNTEMRRIRKSSVVDVGQGQFDTYEGGYIFGAYSGCGWIRSSLSPAPSTPPKFSPTATQTRLGTRRTSSCAEMVYSYSRGTPRGVLQDRRQDRRAPDDAHRPRRTIGNTCGSGEPKRPKRGSRRSQAARFESCDLDARPRDHAAVHHPRRPGSAHRATNPRGKAPHCAPLTIRQDEMIA